MHIEKYTGSLFSSKALFLVLLEFLLANSSQAYRTDYTMSCSTIHSSSW